MKLNGLQVMQLLAMIVCPIAIFSHTQDDGLAAIASCLVVALLFIGVSVCTLANVMAERRNF